MSSRTPAALTELARDIPTSREDVLALRRHRAVPPDDPFAALQALVDQLPAAARKPRRETAAGRAELEL